MPAARRPRPAAAKPAPKSEPTLTPDQVDAIIRDPECPANVKSFLTDAHAAAEYRKSVKFSTDSSGFVTVDRPDA